MQMKENDVRALLADYIGLYRRETLPRWRELFLPQFVATTRGSDGTLTTWGLDAFYERQRTSFETGRPITEVLENTSIDCAANFACVRSDFVWSDGTVSRRGKLMLLLVSAQGRAYVQALAFSY
jgi:hypothetical protein